MAVMNEPKSAGDRPVMQDLLKGSTYAWCSCGLSANQPWCNGAHKGSSFAPQVFEAKEDGESGHVHLQEDQESALLRRFSFGRLNLDHATPMLGWHDDVRGLTLVAGMSQRHVRTTVRPRLYLGPKPQM